MSDPKATVRQYLSKNGYPLEMYVAKQFRLAGFEVYQSTMYVDKETGKDREIDVTAYFVRHFGQVQFSFKIIIECKYATNIWVLFSGENPGFKDFKADSLYCTNYAGSKMLETLSSIDTFNQRLPFRMEQRLGYGITEANLDSKQPESRTTYKAITTLLNALQYEKERDKQEKVFELYIPIIVVQGKFFECYLDELDKEVINEIQEGQLLYKSNIYPGVFPLIEIVTKEKVFDLADKLFTDLDSICTDHFHKMNELMRNFPTASNYFVM